MAGSKRGGRKKDGKRKKQDPPTRALSVVAYQESASSLRSLCSFPTTENMFQIAEKHRRS
jgi:hypothetical protein